MEISNSYVYFALKGKEFDPNEITKQIGILPTETYQKGSEGKNNPNLQFDHWILSKEKGKEQIFIDALVEEIVDKLYDRIDIINKLKIEYHLESVLEIIMYVDINPETSTPALGQNLKTIEFLYKTKTKIDVDIYRYNSEANDKNEQLPITAP